MTVLKKLYFKLPLYRSDKKPIEYISQDRVNTIKEVENKILNSEYKYIKNICLCGCKDINNDIVISEKDRYGFDVKFLLCKKCSLIRTDKKLDGASLSDFYANYYRRIYGDGTLSIEREFSGQALKGSKYKALLEQYISLSTVKTVLDIGCGTGGVLKPFLEMKKDVYGIDYDVDRLEYGKSQGFNLLHAINDKELIKGNKYDLILLSHVMEHFIDPINEINDIFEMVSEDGFIQIIVPSPLNIGKSPRITSRFFQNVHLYNFNQKYLKLFFEELNIKVLFIDEECNCILQKTKSWKRNDIEFFVKKSLKDEYKGIIKHFEKVVLLNDIFKLNHIFYYLLGKVVIFLDFIKLKDFIKKTIKK
jgi:2-polyprenyl-3-methyl-5-hydroxy-6-metoxy-1,4-benzoquinol methylase